MNLKKSFERFFSKKNTEAPADVTPTGWDEVAALNPDANTATFDDLAQLSSDVTPATFDDLETVPFAGASVTEESVTPEHVLPAESESRLDTEMDTTNPNTENPTPSPELRALKNFFVTDLRIKRELMNAAPDEKDNFDEASRMDYADQAYRTFKDFQTDFARINQDFGFNFDQPLNNFFQKGVENFAISNYDAEVINQLYGHEFSDLRRDFVEKVKAGCVGYKLERSSLGDLISSSQSVNELLHAYHSYIMNNEDILQAVPPIAEKENSGGYTITMRGDASPLSQQIFDAIPADLDVGWTDIITAGQHIMMMVRDRGHALTISIETDGAQPDKMWVDYNIPKICNIEMIKALPGISGYTQHGARGGFFAPRDELGAKIADFIARVPMDADLFTPGGLCYAD